MAVKHGPLPFNAQIAFFRKKLNLSTQAWTDIWQAEHDRSFVVAGAMKDDLLTDLRGAVDKAISQGTTLNEFRKDFDKIVATHGWDYKGGRNWRTSIIYDTNLRTSYAAGRYTQLKMLDYWQYHHSPGETHPRPEHVAWDGLVLPKDDPFWDAHYPPNGWRCRCYLTGMSRERMQRNGITPDKSPPVEMEEVTVGARGPSPRTVMVPKGIDPGFAYTPGRSVSPGLKKRRTQAVRKITLPSGKKTQVDVINHNGTEILAQRGLDPTKQQISVEDLKGYIDQIPKKHRARLKEIRLINEYLIEDGKPIKRVVGSFDMDGKFIELYRNSQFELDKAKNVVAQTVRHETGHIIEDSMPPEFLDDWRTAMKSDGAGGVTEYAGTNIHEDVAETLMYHWSHDRNDRRMVEMFFPARYNVMKKYGIEAGS